MKISTLHDHGDKIEIVSVIIPDLDSHVAGFKETYASLDGKNAKTDVQIADDGRISINTVIPYGNKDVNSGIKITESKVTSGSKRAR